MSNKRLEKLISEGISSLDVEGFDIGKVIVRLRQSLQHGEQSGQPLVWDPEKIKKRARERTRRKNRSKR